VVVTAVAPETRAVLAALRRPTRIALPGFRAWTAEAGPKAVTLVQSGIGPARAHAALSAVGTPHDLVLSIGFAGALVPGVEPGDVVLPATIVWEMGSTLARYDVPVVPWSAARAAVPRHLAAGLRDGPVLSSPEVLASVADKRGAAERSGATAVEMEAAALIGVARERGVEVLVLRTILDAADVSLEGLPPDLDASWRARARLVARPDLWSRVIALARHVPRATRNLTEATAAVFAAI
jgi:adenosylhomocysteine nucleosidase